MKFKNLFNYIGQTVEIQKAKSFWNWFIKNQYNFLFMNEVEEKEKERLMELLLKALHNYHDSLYFEIGGNPEDEQLELIITAEGVAKNFPAVELLVELAPAIDNWSVIAFKPPLGPDFKLELGGHVFDPQQIIFIPLVSEKSPGSLGLQICFPDYTKKEEPLFLQGSYLLVDSLLGEKAASLDIHFLKVTETPANFVGLDFRHLCELASYVADRKPSGR